MKRSQMKKIVYPRACYKDDIHLESFKNILCYSSFKLQINFIIYFPMKDTIDVFSYHKHLYKLF